jgi:hypothetical protein
MKRPLTAWHRGGCHAGKECRLGVWVQHSSTWALSARLSAEKARKLVGASAAILATVSFDISGWVAWSARYIAVCMMLVSVLMVMP